jgi:hypothetical protein
MIPDEEMLQIAKLACLTMMTKSHPASVAA